MNKGCIKCEGSHRHPTSTYMCTKCVGLCKIQSCFYKREAHYEYCSTHRCGNPKCKTSMEREFSPYCKSCSKKVVVYKRDPFFPKVEFRTLILCLLHSPDFPLDLIPEIKAFLPVFCGHTALISSTLTRTKYWYCVPCMARWPATKKNCQHGVFEYKSLHPGKYAATRMEIILNKDILALARSKPVPPAMQTVGLKQCELCDMQFTYCAKECTHELCIELFKVRTGACVTGEVCYDEAQQCEVCGKLWD
eukprot:TRINITY_DN12800_c0_g1_i1.p1 TRINITY_DN12800_c0_g1~~TRINITY_DN12800_c0_g1_i1.p1  ORF type:complete len:249 (+),score=11.01 TRINITY_DN12800_c0_g1_i1:40-786(+)